MKKTKAQGKPAAGCRENHNRNPAASGAGEPPHRGLYSYRIERFIKLATRICRACGREE